MMKDYMEKKAKTPGNRPNPSNGSVHRHGHMSNSATVSGVHGPPPNLNLKKQDEHHYQQSFPRSRSFSGRPFETEKVREASASSSSSKMKKITATMRRPKIHSELLKRDVHPVLMNNMKMNTPVEASSVNKMLVNVTVAHSSGPLRLLLSKDATVEEVIKEILALYAKEGRKPLLSNDPASFGLHYSQFSIDCFNTADKIKDLGSRNFFLCSKATAKESCRLSFHGGESAVTDHSCLSPSPSPSSCGKDISRITGPWYKVMQCLLLLS